MQTELIEKVPNDLPAFLVLPYPLYVSIDQASKIAGVSRDDVRAWVETEINPIEHIKTGKHGGRTLIKVSALEPYLERRKYTNVSI